MSRHLAFLCLLALFALLTFSAHGRVGLIGYDECAYAEIAREMELRGEYIAPELNGEPFFEKPPLLYWTQVLGYRLLGVSPAGARLGNGLAALALLAVIYLVARRPLGERAALLATALLGSSLQFAGMAWIALTDLLLSLFLVLALACGHEAFERDRAGRSGGTLWFLLAATAAAVAVLAKGLIGLLLPGAAAFAFLLTTRRLTTVLTPARLVGGTLIAVLLGGSWYLLVGLTHEGGFGFLKELLIEHHFGRFSGAMQGHSGPFFFYVPVLLLGLLPWSPLLVPALARRGCFGAETERGRFLRLFGLGALICFTLFSITATKLPNYALPIFPFAALLVADLVARLEKPAPKLVRGALLTAQLGLVLLGAFALALPLLLPRVPEWIGDLAAKEPAWGRVLELGAAPYLLALAAFAAAASSFVASRRGDWLRASAALVAGSCALLVVVSWQVLPRYQEHVLRPLHEASLAAAREVEAGERLVLVGIRQRPEIVFVGGCFTEFVAPRKAERLDELFGPGSRRVGLATERVFEQHLRGRSELAVISVHQGWVLFRRVR
jgi:4-amino-4-deoxy-L-arabinose transferase-like glycosyltransferase